jgi:Dolichyl-phosphate-mannose-protein mannosyltransferase
MGPSATSHAYFDSPATSVSQTDRLLLLLIVLLWISMSLLINPIGDFPVNDDWIYGGAVKSLLSADGFHMPGAVRGPTIANHIAQAAWGALFTLRGGFSYTALRISTLALGGLGLGFFFALLRENGTGRPMALAATMTLAVNVFFVDLAHSFMTDVPWTAVLVIALYFLARALRTGSRNALAAGVTVSFAGILIKQVGFAPLLGYAVANGLKHRFQVRPTVAGLLPLVFGVALHFGFQTWLLNSGRGFFWISWEVPWDPVSLLLWTMHAVLYSAPYIGLGVFPMVVMTGLLPPSWQGGHASRLGLAGVSLLGALALAGLWWKGDLIPFLLNVLTPTGLGPLTQRDTYLLRQNLPPVTVAVTLFWLGVTACALAGLVSLVLVGGAGAVRRLTELASGRVSPATLLSAMVIVTGLGYGVAIILLATQTAEFFDRYTLPAIPLALVVLVVGDSRTESAPRPPWRGWVTAGVLVAVGGLSVAGTHDYLAWNRTRWEAARYLTAELGVPATEIDGGYEFNGGAGYHWRQPISIGKSWWWVQNDTYVLASGPIPGYREVRRFRVANKYLPVGLQDIVVLQRTEGQ